MATIFVVSGPSGAGKSTLIERLNLKKMNIVWSVSVTTRRPRRGERDGVNYRFITRDEFEQMVVRNEFVEWATVYDAAYGTSRPFIDQALAAGRDLLLDIDSQGAKKIREAYPNRTVTIFVMPESESVLQQRLTGRGTDDPLIIERRMAVAKSEMACAAAYDYVLINDDVDRAVAALRSIVIASRCRAIEMLPRIAEIIKTR